MFRKRKPPVASRPGTLAMNHQAPPSRVHVVNYAPDGLQEHDVSDLGVLSTMVNQDSVTWIDVEGLGSEDTLRSIAEIFQIHPLALADVVNVPQRPKVEPYDDHIFFVTPLVRLDEQQQLDQEQLSLFLGANYVLSFRERHGDSMEALRKRIRLGQGPILQQGADYLAYAILDAVVDGYFPVLESLGESLEGLEDEALEARSKTVLKRINHSRHILVTLRRTLFSQREALSTVVRRGSPLISDDVRIYLRDVHDHCTQVYEVLESYREIVSSLTNTYMSAVSNRTNDVMKVLTIMASIFIPLTFMAGIYGMNFEYMPELRVPYAYPLLWLAMVFVALALLLFFSRKGWLGSAGDHEDEDHSGD